jgi:hypothetical protein
MVKRQLLRRVAAGLALAVAGFALAGVLTGSSLGFVTSSGTSGTVTTGTTGTTTQPRGGEGCTPGYWKNHTEDWVGYLPGQSVGSVFSNAGSLGSTTLLAALKAGGGPTLADAKRLLLHHAVAALLNAAHPDVDYAFTPAQVIAWTNELLTSSDRAAILRLKDLFDRENNRGCPLS